MGYPTDLFIDQDISDGFLCTICHDVLKDPAVMNPCEHTYCRTCGEQWLKKSKTCPTDRKRVTKLKNAQRSFISVLNDLKMRCPFNETGCTATFKLGDFTEHDERCTFNPENQKECAGGCGEILTQAQIKAKTHDCIEYLKKQLEAKDKLVQAKETELVVMRAELTRSQEQVSKLDQNLQHEKEQKSQLEAEMKTKDIELGVKSDEMERCQEQMRKLDRNEKEQNSRHEDELKAKETELGVKVEELARSQELMKIIRSVKQKVMEQNSLLEAELKTKDAQLTNCRRRINEMEHQIAAKTWNDGCAASKEKLNRSKTLASCDDTPKVVDSPTTSAATATAVASSSRGQLKRKLDIEEISELKTAVLTPNRNSSLITISEVELKDRQNIGPELYQIIVNVVITELQIWFPLKKRWSTVVNVQSKIETILNGQIPPRDNVPNLDDGRKWKVHICFIPDRSVYVPFPSFSSYSTRLIFRLRDLSIVVLR